MKFNLDQIADKLIDTYRSISYHTLNFYRVFTDKPHNHLLNARFYDEDPKYMSNCLTEVPSWFREPLGLYMTE